MTPLDATPTPTPKGAPPTDHPVDPPTVLPTVPPLPHLVAAPLNPTPEQLAEQEARWARRAAPSPVDPQAARAVADEVTAEVMARRSAEPRHSAPAPSPSARRLTGSLVTARGPDGLERTTHRLPTPDASSLPTIPAEQAAEMRPATIEMCETAIAVIHGTMGLGPATSASAARAAELERDFYERVTETAAVLAASGWTVAMLRAAGRVLATSPQLDDKIRYGRPVTAADFERVRQDGLEVSRTRDESGDGLAVERVIVTRTGYALKVAAAKLYSRHEAFGLWEASGSPGRFSDAIRADGSLTDYPDAMFTLRRVEGAARPSWVIK